MGDELGMEPVPRNPDKQPPNIDPTYTPAFYSNSLIRQDMTIETTKPLLSNDIHYKSSRGTQARPVKIKMSRFPPIAPSALHGDSQKAYDDIDATTKAYFGDK